MKAILLIAVLVALGIGAYLYASGNSDPSGGHTPHSMQPE
jgi:hypothetical protein